MDFELGLKDYSKFILKSGEDYNTRLSQLSLHSPSNRRFTIRDVVFLYNLINGHYNIDLSDRLLFCKDLNVGYDLRKNGSLDIKETVGISSFKHEVMSFLSNTYT